MKASSLQATRKKKKVDVFVFLPDDVLLEMFKKLPPNLLRYKVKFVCRRWYDLITNWILLDHASLILQKPATNDRLRLMDITETEQGLKTKEEYINIPYSGRIKCWCNDRLLLTDENKAGPLYMFNLITQKGSLLPPCSTSCGGHYGVKCGVSLSYDESKRVYKIVHVFMGPPIQCELLILKSNITRYNRSKWKNVNGPIYTGQREYFWDDPVSVRGRYLHWDVHSPKYFVSMDTVQETFRQTGLPGSDVYPMNTPYTMFEMGGCLALLHKITFDQVNIWMLKDFQGTKWEKFLAISGPGCACLRIYPGSGNDDLFPLNDYLFPVISVKSKRCINFKRRAPKTVLYSYDLEKKIMKRLEIDIQGDERCVVHSVSSSFC